MACPHCRSLAGWAPCAHSSCQASTTAAAPAASPRLLSKHPFAFCEGLISSRRTAPGE